MAATPTRRAGPHEGHSPKCLPEAISLTATPEKNRLFSSTSTSPAHTDNSPSPAPAHPRRTRATPGKSSEAQNGLSSNSRSPTAGTADSPAAARHSASTPMVAQQTLQGNQSLNSRALFPFGRAGSTPPTADSHTARKSSHGEAQLKVSEAVVLKDAAGESATRKAKASRTRVKAPGHTHHTSPHLLAVKTPTPSRVLYAGDTSSSPSYPRPFRALSLPSAQSTRISSTDEIEGAASARVRKQLELKTPDVHSPPGDCESRTPDRAMQQMHAGGKTQSALSRRATASPSAPASRHQPAGTAPQPRHDATEGTMLANKSVNRTDMSSFARSNPHLTQLVDLLDNKVFSEEDVLLELEAIRRRSMLTSAPFNRHLLPILAFYLLKEKFGEETATRYIGVLKRPTPDEDSQSTEDGYFIEDRPSPFLPRINDIRRQRREAKKVARTQRPHLFDIPSAKGSSGPDADGTAPSSPARSPRRQPKYALLDESATLPGKVLAGPAGSEPSADAPPRASGTAGQTRPYHGYRTHTPASNGHKNGDQSSVADYTVLAVSLLRDEVSNVTEQRHPSSQRGASRPGRNRYVVRQRSVSDHPPSDVQAPETAAEVATTDSPLDGRTARAAVTSRKEAGGATGVPASAATKTVHQARERYPDVTDNESAVFDRSGCLYSALADEANLNSNAISAIRPLPGGAGVSVSLARGRLAEDGRSAATTVNASSIAHADTAEQSCDSRVNDPATASAVEYSTCTPQTLTQSSQEAATPEGKRALAASACTPAAVGHTMTFDDTSAHDAYVPPSMLLPAGSGSAVPPAGDSSASARGRPMDSFVQRSVMMVDGDTYGSMMRSHTRTTEDCSQPDSTVHPYGSLLPANSGAQSAHSSSGAAAESHQTTLGVDESRPHTAAATTYSSAMPGASPTERSRTSSRSTSASSQPPMSTSAPDSDVTVSTIGEPPSILQVTTESPSSRAEDASYAGVGTQYGSLMQAVGTHTPRSVNNSHVDASIHIADDGYGSLLPDNSVEVATSRGTRASTKASMLRSRTRSGGYGSLLPGNSGVDASGAVGCRSRGSRSDGYSFLRDHSTARLASEGHSTRRTANSSADGQRSYDYRSLLRDSRSDGSCTMRSSMPTGSTSARADSYGSALQMVSSSSQEKSRVSCGSAFHPSRRSDQREAQTLLSQRTASAKKRSRTSSTARESLQRSVDAVATRSYGSLLERSAHESAAPSRTSTDQQSTEASQTYGSLMSKLHDRESSRDARRLSQAATATDGTGSGYGSMLPGISKLTGSEKANRTTATSNSTLPNDYGSVMQVSAAESRRGTRASASVLARSSTNRSQMYGSLLGPGANCSVHTSDPSVTQTSAHTSTARTADDGSFDCQSYGSVMHAATQDSSALPPASTVSDARGSYGSLLPGSAAGAGSTRHLTTTAHTSKEGTYGSLLGSEHATVYEQSRSPHSTRSSARFEDNSVLAALRDREPTRGSWRGTELSGVDPKAVVSRGSKRGSQASLHVQQLAAAESASKHSVGGGYGSLLEPPSGVYSSVGGSKLSAAPAADNISSTAGPPYSAYEPSASVLSSQHTGVDDSAASAGPSKVGGSATYGSLLQSHATGATGDGESQCADKFSALEGSSAVDDCSSAKRREPSSRGSVAASIRAGDSSAAPSAGYGSLVQQSMLSVKGQQGGSAARGAYGSLLEPPSGVFLTRGENVASRSGLEGAYGSLLERSAQSAAEATDEETTHKSAAGGVQYSALGTLTEVASSSAGTAKRPSVPHSQPKYSVTSSTHSVSTGGYGSVLRVPSLEHSTAREQEQGHYSIVTHTAEMTTQQQQQQQHTEASPDGVPATGPRRSRVGSPHPCQLEDAQQYLSNEYGSFLDLGGVVSASSNGTATEPLSVTPEATVSGPQASSQATTSAPVRDAPGTCVKRMACMFEAPPYVDSFLFPHANDVLRPARRDGDNGYAPTHTGSAFEFSGLYRDRGDAKPAAVAPKEKLPFIFSSAEMRRLYGARDDPRLSAEDQSRDAFSVLVDRATEAAAPAVADEKDSVAPAAEAEGSAHNTQRKGDKSSFFDEDRFFDALDRLQVPLAASQKERMRRSLQAKEATPEASPPAEPPANVLASTDGAVACRGDYSIFSECEALGSTQGNSGAAVSRSPPARALGETVQAGIAAAQEPSPPPDGSARAAAYSRSNGPTGAGQAEAAVHPPRRGSDGASPDPARAPATAGTVKKGIGFRQKNTSQSPAGGTGPAGRGRRRASADAGGRPSASPSREDELASTGLGGVTECSHVDESFAANRSVNVTVLSAHTDDEDCSAMRPLRELGSPPVSILQRTSILMDGASPNISVRQLQLQSEGGSLDGTARSAGPAAPGGTTLSLPPDFTRLVLGVDRCLDDSPRGTDSSAAAECTAKDSLHSPRGAAAAAAEKDELPATPDVTVFDGREVSIFNVSVEHYARHADLTTVLQQSRADSTLTPEHGVEQTDSSTASDVSGTGGDDSTPSSSVLAAGDGSGSATPSLQASQESMEEGSTIVLHNPPPRRAVVQRVAADRVNQPRTVQQQPPRLPPYRRANAGGPVMAADAGAGHHTVPHKPTRFHVPDVPYVATPELSPDVDRHHSLRKEREHDNFVARWAMRGLLWKKEEEEAQLREEREAGAGAALLHGRPPQHQPPPPVMGRQDMALYLPGQAAPCRPGQMLAGAFPVAARQHAAQRRGAGHAGGGRAPAAPPSGRR